MHTEHHHDLAHEFPEFKQRIHELKLISPEFKQLYDKYQTIDKEIYRIEEEIETPCDDYTEELKRKRVHLKDRLHGMLTGRIPPDSGNDEFVTRHRFARPVDIGAVTRDWIGRGFSCRAYADGIEATTCASLHSGPRLHPGVEARAARHGCRGCGLTDPPGQEWRDFVHDTNELVTVVEGRLVVTMGEQSWVLEPGDELFIPRGMLHTVRNIRADTTRWLYGYD